MFVYLLWQFNLLRPYTKHNNNFYGNLNDNKMERVPDNECDFLRILNSINGDKTGPLLLNW